MSTDIRQLKKDNEVFYPQTHINGVIGLDDELATKANIDGYYESMGVGISDDLKGDINTPSQFIYRKTGGDTEANTGTANVSLFKGNTVKFNQLVDTDTTSVTLVSGHSYYTNISGTKEIVAGDGSSVSVTGGTDTIIDLTNAGLSSLTTVADVEAWLAQNIGYKDYYAYTSGKLLSFGGYSIKWNQLVNTDTTSVPTTSGYKYLKVTQNTPNIVTGDGNAITGLTGGVDQVFDLTTMFSQGNEPSQTQFEAWFLQGSTPGWSTTYYPYNAGEVKNILEATNQQLGIETVGFNQWDEEWERGTIDPTTGQNYGGSESSWIRSINYIPCLPNTSYYFQHPNISFGIRWYDANKNYIGYVASTSVSASNTTPVNCRYMRITQNRNTYDNNICVNLSDGNRNGTYESYQKNTLNLDWIKSLEYTPTGSSTPVKMFPDGLLSAGTVYDEINERQAIKRVGVVDLGSLTWEYNSALTCFRSRSVPGMVYSTGSNAICIKYPIVDSITFSSTTNDKILSIASRAIFGDGTADVAVRDTTYGSNYGNFKTAMSGVYLYYQLATPIVIDLDPTVPRNLVVDNKGTERLIPENGSYPVTGAFNGNIRYDINAVETLRNLKTNFISKGSFDNFLGALNSALGSTMGGTIEYTSSLDENGDYDFELVESTQGE